MFSIIQDGSETVGPKDTADLSLHSAMRQLVTLNASPTQQKPEDEPFLSSKKQWDWNSCKQQDSWIKGKGKKSCVDLPALKSPENPGCVTTLPCLAEPLKLDGQVKFTSSVKFSLL